MSRVRQARVESPMMVLSADGTTITRMLTATACATTMWKDFATITGIRVTDITMSMPTGMAFVITMRAVPAKIAAIADMRSPHAPAMLQALHLPEHPVSVLMARAQTGQVAHLAMDMLMLTAMVFVTITETAVEHIAITETVLHPAVDPLREVLRVMGATTADIIGKIRPYH